MKRLAWGLAVALLLGGGLSAYLRSREALALGPAPTAAEIEQMRAERSQLRDRFQALLDEHGILDFAKAPEGNILVGVPSGFTQDLVGQMVTGLFSEVRLRLRNITAHAEGDVKAKVLFSTQTLGRYSLDVNVKEVRALLKPARPELNFGGDKIGIALRVAVAEGRGEANMHFRWNGQGLAGAVCGDVDVESDVSSEVVPAQYEVKGEFLLSAEGDTVVAKPRFGEVVLKVVLRPMEQAWAMFQSTLEEVKDDKNGICGMAIKKLDVRSIVQKIIDKGFQVKLPRELFREISLPAAVEQAVTIQGKTVSLDAHPIGLRVSERMLWYGVALGAAAGSPPPPDGRK
ncbi:MAG TPA: hypothetical protein VI589_06285 [Vicinamibacteria bacterium]